MAISIRLLVVIGTLLMLFVGCSPGPSGPPATPTSGPFQCGYELRGGNEGPYHNRIEVMAYGADAQVCDQIARYFFPYQMQAFQPQSGASSRVLVCRGKLGASEVRIYDRHPFGDQAATLCTSWLHGQWVADSAR